MNFSSRLLITFLLLFSVIAGNCQAPQTALSADLQKRIEHQVRAYAEAPPEASITLLPRYASEFLGYDVQPVAIKVGEKIKKFEFLLAKDGSRLLYVTSFDLRSDPFERTMQKIDTLNRPFRGSADAPVTVVMYDDFQCPFCAKLYQQLVPIVMNQYRSRVRFVLKDLPISEGHMWARRAALDADCLGKQSPDAYWAFADYVHTHQSEFNEKFKDDLGQALDALAARETERRGLDKSALQSCLASQNTSAIDASLTEGKSLSITATPTIFVNGQGYEGVLTAPQIRAALDRALRETQEQRAAQ